jgi:diguanylate cyclase (GGDEF)-like protein
MSEITGSRAAGPDVADLTLAAALASAILTSAVALAWLGAGFDAAAPDLDVWKIALSLSIAAPAWAASVFAGRTCRRLQELALSRDALIEFALRDPLTGLLNRRGFDLAAKNAFERAARSGAPVAALMLDIDWFKKINDRYGHHFGDVALREIAGVARAELGRRNAVLGRWGGEEFAVLLPGDDIARADELASAVRAACAAHLVERDGLAARITVSIGVAAAPAGRVELDTLLGWADAALFQAKRDGRDRVVSDRPRQEPQASNARARSVSS